MTGRFFEYQTERFPILLLLPAVLLSTLSVALYVTAPTDVPFSLLAYISSFIVAFGLLALTRIADEHRDFKYDSTHHPERPVPAGLVTLHELRIAGGIFASAMLVSVFFVSPYLLISLAVVFVYFTLTSVSFFCKNFVFKHTELFIFLRALTLTVSDVFTIMSQHFANNSNIEILPTLIFVLARLFAFYALDTALRRTTLQAISFKKVRHIYLFASTALSFILFIFSLVFLSVPPLFYIIASIAFLTSMTCIFFSNTSHRLLRTETFGVFVYSLIVVLLPCFASRLI